MESTVESNVTATNVTATAPAIITPNTPNTPTPQSAIDITDFSLIDGAIDKHAAEIAGWTDLNDLILSPNDLQKETDRRHRIEGHHSYLRQTRVRLQMFTGPYSNYLASIAQYDRITGELEQLLASEPLAKTDSFRAETIRIALHYLTYHKCDYCGHIAKNPPRDESRQGPWCPECHNIRPMTPPEFTGFALLYNMTDEDRRNRGSYTVQAKIRPYSTRSLLEDIDPSFNLLEEKLDYFTLKFEASRLRKKIVQEWQSVAAIIDSAI